jgi:hypothetical protein
MKHKATKQQTERRVEEFLRILLDGAEFWDIREYVREKEKEEGSAWHLPDGATPLSDSQIRRLAARADALIGQSRERSRRKAIRLHLARRRNLYAKAVLAGDVRSALACLRDEAELLGLYPPKERKLEHSGKGPAPEPVSFIQVVRDYTDEELLAIIARGEEGASDRKPVDIWGTGPQ